jgi:hypothetical protein
MTRGDWIVWITDKGLALLSHDGARTELLNGDPGWQSYGFSKDGSEVYGICMNEAHRLVTEAVDIATRGVRTVSDLGPAVGIHAFSLAPDGKSFLTSLWRDCSESGGGGSGRRCGAALHVAGLLSQTVPAAQSRQNILCRPCCASFAKVGSFS